MSAQVTFTTPLFSLRKKKEGKKKRKKERKKKEILANTRGKCNRTIYGAQKKKLNGPEGSKYFFPVERGKFLLAPL